MISDDELEPGNSGSSAEASGRSLAAELWGPGLAAGQTVQVVASKIIRDVSQLIQPSMTAQGLEILIFCSETVDKDCPKVRSGGAALAAAQ